jgi:hypothetical protein
MSIRHDHSRKRIYDLSQIVFVFEIFIQFFIGFYDKQGIYQDSFSKVVKNYLQGMFLFDVCTSTPISWLEVPSHALCAPENARR